MIQLTESPIDPMAAIEQLRSVHAGAVVTFLGTTREWTQGRRTITLHYDGYRDMAVHQLNELERLARDQFDLVDCVVIHRLGNVPLAEASVLVAVSAAHRGPAFAAAEWLMNKLKAEVPIWKQEHWSDGTVEWVHPGAESTAGVDRSTTPDDNAAP